MFKKHRPLCFKTLSAQASRRYKSRCHSRPLGGTGCVCRPQQCSWSTSIRVRTLYTRYCSIVGSDPNFTGSRLQRLSRRRGKMWRFGARSCAKSFATTALPQSPHILIGNLVESRSQEDAVAKAIHNSTCGSLKSRTFSRKLVRIDSHCSIRCPCWLASPLLGS